MPKAGEMTFFEQIGEERRQFSIRKPFSLGQGPGPFNCGDYLLAFGGRTGGLVQLVK